MHRHICPLGCPIWRPTLRPKPTRRIQCWIRFPNLICDPTSENTRVRVDPPKTIRIQNWTRNLVAGFLPDWPALGGMGEKRQMLVYIRPYEAPIRRGPQTGGPTHPRACLHPIMIILVGENTLHVWCRTIDMPRIRKSRIAWESSFHGIRNPRVDPHAFPCLLLHPPAS